MSEEKSTIAIIGGGISGLAVGCYLQMNGYRTSIFEQNQACGGVMYPWKRGKYLFDGATNWLAGSGAQSSMHNLLKELFDFSDMTIIDPDEFICVEYDSHVLHVYCDANRLKEEMLRIAPEDGSTIEAFTNAITLAGTISLPYNKAPELFSIFDYLTFIIKHFSFVTFFLKWKRITVGNFATRFTNPILRTLFLRIFPRHEHFSIMSIILTLGWMNIKSGGYPIGGSQKLIDQLIRKYKSIGGTLYVNSSVKKITIDNNRTTGIQLDNGIQYNSEYVISTIDKLFTINKLLSSIPEIQSDTAKIDQLPVFPGLIQISLGCKRVFEHVSHKINMQLCEKIDCGEGGVLEEIMVRICNFDPTLAPDGSTAIIAHIRTPHYKFWCDLRKTNVEKYKLLKQKIADITIDTLDKRFGNIRATIESTDVATPATFIRYTNISKSSYQGWAPTPSLIGKTLPKTIHSIKNLYLCGQWVWAAGGIPGVIRIARHTAQIICNKDKKEFIVRDN
jgi:phytoene dehydrogenase-like protein